MKMNEEAGEAFQECQTPPQEVPSGEEAVSDILGLLRAKYGDPQGLQTLLEEGEIIKKELRRLELLEGPFL